MDQRANVDEKAFAAELAREWSIETGVIEGVYTLDRGTTEILIRRGIDSSYISRESTDRPPELVAQIIQAHEDGLEGLFDFVANRRELSTSYIKELHSALLQHEDTVKGVDQFGTAVYIELQKGLYKKQPNSPTRRDKTVHEYCPPEHVPSEMDRLIEFHKQHVQRDVPPLAEAAWLHHTFTQIHPFQDGNGRVARALASLVLIKGGFFPLVVHRDDWEKYIDALEAADEGDLTQLVGLFARLQKRDLTRAIGRAADMRPVGSVYDAVQVTRDLLVNLGRINSPDHREAKRTAGRLSAATRDHFDGIAKQLGEEITRGNADFTFGAALDSSTAEELSAVARKLKYDPNPSDYSGDAALSLRAHGAEARIVVSFHTVGASFRGLIGVAAYFQAGTIPPVPLSDDIFRIDYKEHFDELQMRYLGWLDGCVVRGLAEWRKTLV